MEEERLSEMKIDFKTNLNNHQQFILKHGNVCFSVLFLYSVKHYVFTAKAKHTLIILETKNGSENQPNFHDVMQTVCA